MAGKRLVELTAVIAFLTLIEPARPLVYSEADSVPTSQTIKASAGFDRLPLIFLPGPGSSSKSRGFMVAGRNVRIGLDEKGMTYVFNREGLLPAGSPSFEAGAVAGGRRSVWTIRASFVGSNPDVRPVGKSAMGSRVSYFKCRPEDWKSGIPAYGGIAYHDLWPGVDLSVTGAGERLKSDFIVQPGADPALIRLAYRGADRVRLDAQGRMEIQYPGGSFFDDAPSAYQDIEGTRVEIPVRYRLQEAHEGVPLAVASAEAFSGRAYEYGFELGPYDRSHPLVIDPVIIVYSGYLGGVDTDDSAAIAVDRKGCVYVTGYTYSNSLSFPVEVGPGFDFGGEYDVFVAKINAAGTDLVYCGYIGGGGNDSAYGIAVDDAGCAYVTGGTDTPEATIPSNYAGFPVKKGPDLTWNGKDDAFVAKINAEGTDLEYCGYIGGELWEAGQAIKVDKTGCVYITGQSLSSEATFPVKTGPDLTINGFDDAFVAKIDATGTEIIYCGYIGGDNCDGGMGIDIDKDGNAYVCGFAYSHEGSFPVKAGPDLTHGGGSMDGFVAKVNAAGTGLDYCGYIGGAAEYELCRAIAVDKEGHAYVTGYTCSDQATFPVRIGPDLTHGNPGGAVSDAFVAKIEADGNGFSYCGYIGGSETECGTDIKVDGEGNAFVVGLTLSNEYSFPVRNGPDLTYNGGSRDAFVAEVIAAGTGLAFCGYIGGYQNDAAEGLAMAGPENLFITGGTYSSWGFPLSSGPDLTYNGGYLDAFVTRLRIPDRRSDDLLGSWPGQGVFMRNSDSGLWTGLASEASLLAAGDLDGDRRDDLLGLWPSQNGVWARLSGSGQWSLLATPPGSLAAGEMDGGGCDDLVGSWNGQGVFFRSSEDGTWTWVSNPASRIAVGPVDDDLIDDLIGVWPDQGGVWAKLSDSGEWLHIASTADEIAAGDLDADGKDELLGTWASLGIYSYDFQSNAWTHLSLPAARIAAADVDGDGKDDLIGDWPAQGGIWVRFSGTTSWDFLASSASALAAGTMRSTAAADGASRGAPRSAPSPAAAFRIPEPLGKPGSDLRPQQPRLDSGSPDLSDSSPGGRSFGRRAMTEPAFPPRVSRRLSPGPGDPGFTCLEGHNLVPGQAAPLPPSTKRH